MTVKVMRYTMVVRHPETHVATALLTGKPVPDWATDLVQPDDLETAPDKAEGSQDEAPKPAKKAAAKRSASK